MKPSRAHGSPSLWPHLPSLPLSRQSILAESTFPPLCWFSNPLRPGFSHLFTKTAVTEATGSIFPAKSGACDSVVQLPAQHLWCHCPPPSRGACLASGTALPMFRCLSCRPRSVSSLTLPPPTSPFLSFLPQPCFPARLSLPFAPYSLALPLPPPLSPPAVSRQSHQTPLLSWLQVPSTCY